MMQVDSPKDHYIGVLLEEIQSKQDFVLEVVSGLAGLPADVRQLKEDMAEVKQDIKVIKFVIKEARIVKLEASN